MLKKTHLITKQLQNMYTSPYITICLTVVTVKRLVLLTIRSLNKT